MRVADFIFRFLHERGVDTVFMVSGGQAMFLVDAVCQNKGIRALCTHHEQSAGMAAEAYGRLTGKLGVALVTAGPGAVNVMNGVAGGWTDSAPMMILSGQSGYSFVRYQQNHPIRQYGIQGINIGPLVEKVTKYFVTVDDPAKILFYLQKAYFLAFDGRPGPVWIEVPLDVQKMEVPEGLCEEFVPPPSCFDRTQLSAQVGRVLDSIRTAKRPILLVGQGVRSAGALPEMIGVLDRVKIPVLTARLGIDLINSDHPLYVGRPGNYGDRAANFAIQNADLILVVGCRLASALVGHDPKNFGKHAKKIVVDIDGEELQKPGVEIGIKIHDDARRFFTEFLRQAATCMFPDFSLWAGRCRSWRETYQVVLDSYKKETPVNSYYFAKVLSDLATKDDVILVDTGTCFHVLCQVWQVKKGQRFLTTGGISSMGYWAAGLGACLANDRKSTIVVTGDGSLQMNIQEFATIKHNRLPVKVFIFNNNGYLLIRHTQKNFLEGRLFGEGPETGVWCPDSLKIASAYGIKGVRISSPDEVEAGIREVLQHDGPVICDVITPEWQLIVPRISSDKRADGTLVSRPYEDMFPFLDRDELRGNMIAEQEEDREAVDGRG